MKKHIYNKNNGLHYTLSKDEIYYPDLKFPDSKTYHIGKYGSLHKSYLKENHKIFFMSLVTEGKLNKYLHDIDVQTADEVDKIVTAMAKRDNTNELLKATNQMKWVGLMNNYRHCAEEIVFRDIIYKK